LKAERIDPRPLPHGRHTAIQLKGIRYQRALGKALTKNLKEVTITSEPWYKYALRIGKSYSEYNICSPDFLIEKDDIGIVIEVKLTFVHGAVEKLINLYVPTVIAAHKHLKHIVPLIITRTLTPSAPPTITRISQALNVKHNSVPVLQWLDKRSPLTW
jgi:hypothetical protein